MKALAQEMAGGLRLWPSNTDVHPVYGQTSKVIKLSGFFFVFFFFRFG